MKIGKGELPPLLKGGGTRKARAGGIPRPWVVEDADPYAQIQFTLYQL